ncbi:MAG: CBS domain-containing protein [Acidimicrobiales bacterium]
MFIEQILKDKGRDVATVTSSSVVREALGTLREHGIGALIVCDDGTTIAGILSERDIVRALADRGADVLTEAVAVLMSTEVVTATESVTIEQLMAMMTDRRIRHVPIVDEQGLRGIVSIGDVVKSRLRELETERGQLVEYISRGG